MTVWAAILRVPDAATPAQTFESLMQSMGNSRDGSGELPTHFGECRMSE